jgi:hypothetical protein
VLSFSALQKLAKVLLSLPIEHSTTSPMSQPFLREDQSLKEVHPDQDNALPSFSKEQRGE